MKVGFVQLKPEFGQVKKNVRRAIKLMKKQHADLYVLPELFNTGYAFKSKDEVFSFAENGKNGFTANALADFSFKHKTAVVFGYAEIAGEKCFNSCMFVDAERNLINYRKVHLFYREKEVFSYGTTPLKVFKYKSAKIGMMICFDWIFPEVARSLALMGAQVICHPSNLVMPYCQQAMVTRSIENRIFTITANRVGVENLGNEKLTFTGKSQITDCNGNILYRAGDSKEELYVTDIDVEKSKNKNINEFNDILKDRRESFYHVLGKNK